MLGGDRGTLPLDSPDYRLTTARIDKVTEGQPRCQSAEYQVLFAWPHCDPCWSPFAPEQHLLPSSEDIASRFQLPATACTQSERTMRGGAVVCFKGALRFKSLCSRVSPYAR